MKKMIVLLALVLLAGGFLFAEFVDDGELRIYGKIIPGTTDFQVVQDMLIGDRVDLLSSAVAPSGDGYIIGSWIYAANNQPATSFEVTYEYDGLLGTAPNTIEYALLEYAAEATTGGTVLNTTSDTTEFTSTAGNYEDGRNIGFKLTETGVTQALSLPSGNYEDVITITLATL
jgi:hypothetical protein